MKCEHSGLEYGTKGEKPCRLVTCTEVQGDKIATLQSCLCCPFSSATYEPNPNYIPDPKNAFETKPTKAGNEKA